MDRAEMTHNQAAGIRDCIASLMAYCQKNNWAGFDPYDALNSRVFNFTPFAKSRVCRIAITQIMKRLPVNLRPLLLVPREQNPKAIALFLMALLKLSKLGLLDQKDLVGDMVEKLVALRSPNTSYWCWGYSFPWQTRRDLVPRWSPNLVCTSFVANALLDAYEQTQETSYLSMARSAGDYLLNDLYWTEGDSIAGFSYPLPGMRTRTHNANFLGSALLCRLYTNCGERGFLEPALKVARYSAGKQHENGSWDYGELTTQRWIDNFHTGYNLCALRSIGESTGSSEFEQCVYRGFNFYRAHFFTKKNAPRYFADRTFPIDIHSVAQSMITLLALKDLHTGNSQLAFSVYELAMTHMWDRKAYFYYQVLPLWTNKISYMRWSQAWMLFSLATLLEHCEPAEVRMGGGPMANQRSSHEPRI
jgi:hypothetical protein